MSNNVIRFLFIDLSLPLLEQIGIGGAKVQKQALQKIFQKFVANFGDDGQ